MPLVETPTPQASEASPISSVLCLPRYFMMYMIMIGILGAASRASLKKAPNTWYHQSSSLL
jgi:hypothetical protein